MEGRLVGGLLGAAVSLTVLVAPAATAADVPCGAPAVPAVHETVTHPAGEQTVPAQTHEEHLWTRDVEVLERQYVLTAAGYTGYEWTRESGVVEGPDGVLTSSKESILLPKGVEPEGDGWELTGRTFWVKDKGATLWSVTPPQGAWEPTGKKRVAYVVTETTDVPSAQPPPGKGWTPVPGSAVTVVDVPEQVVDHPGPWTEEVLVSPAIPAGEPCPSDRPTEPGTGPAATSATGPTTDPTVLGVQEHRPAAGAPAAVPTAVDAGLPSGREPVPWSWFAALGLGTAAAGVRVWSRRPSPRH